VEAVRNDTKKNRDQVHVMLTVKLPKTVLRAESRKTMALDAVDSCTEKMEEQIKRYKDMHSGKAKAHKAKRMKVDFDE
jgi:ribosome-associated translation inhibitor RaiA